VTSERDKMLAGELYRPEDPELVEERRRCRERLAAFNAAPGFDALAALVGAAGDGAEVVAPLMCDYGWNISLGERAFLNAGAVILDCAPVTIGPLSLIGPNVQLLAADHPRDPDLRRRDLEMAAPVSVGENTWIGAGAILCPGVSVGDDSIVGAGSVVTRDVPAGVVAAGNPCRVIRRLEPQ
jgi:maltose O-acetyltransferase